MSSYSDEEDQDIEEFEDATDVLNNEEKNVPQNITLQKAIEEAELAITYFFNNQFEEARSLMTPYANVSIYHALGHSVFLYLEAMLTFEPRHISAASKALKSSLQVCNKFRKKDTLKESIGKIVVKRNYDLFTEQEVHAELCYAESLLLKSMLIFIEDETLGSFIKAGLKIRSCYSSYKECLQILTKKNWNECPSKIHFESGVKMGIGTFNLMISMLPSRVIKLLEFIGFSGNKELGLQDIHKGYEMGGLRQVLCIMTLLGYNLMVLYIVSHREGDLDICEQILTKQLKNHPNGVWFLFFKGRLEFMKGNLEKSEEWYIKSWKSQNLWPQFHHLCFWELFWIECVKTDWKKALEYSTVLIEESKWSRTIYSYQKAVIMLMLEGQESDKAAIDSLMADVPKYKQRIAGKSLPIEKFAIKKADRYFQQNGILTLAVIEMMYLWNLFKVFKTFEIASSVYRVIDKTVQDISNTSKPSKFDKDNQALVLLLQGACLRHMNSPLQALECLETVISMKKDIVEDTYLVPYAIVELALIEWERGKKEKAILALEDVKKNFTGYLLESRLHFRIHTALSEFKQEFNNS